MFSIENQRSNLNDDFFLNLYFRRPDPKLKSNISSTSSSTVDKLKNKIELLKERLQRRTLKISEVAELYGSYDEQYKEFDYFLTQPDLPNPWVTDCTEFWETEKQKDVSHRHVKRWSFGLKELLNDSIGREQFTKFLDKEYSGENLKFWEAVQEMKSLSQAEVGTAADNIWKEFLSPDAPCPINVDSKSLESTREALNSPNGPNRWCFDIAAAHVYHLMKSDSYSRYLRSEMYKEILNGSKKKSIRPLPNLFGGVKRQLTS